MKARSTPNKVSNEAYYNAYNELYLKQNMTFAEIGQTLKVGHSAVHQAFRARKFILRPRTVKESHYKSF